MEEGDGGGICLALEKGRRLEVISSYGFRLLPGMYRGGREDAGRRAT